MDEDYDGENRVAELIGGGDAENDGIELRATDVKIRGSGKIRTGKRPQLQIQIDDGRYGDTNDARNTKYRDNRVVGVRGNQQQYDANNQQQFDDNEEATEVPSPRVRRPEPHKKKHPLRPTRSEMAEAAFWRALGLGFPLNIFGLGGFGGYGALGRPRNFGMFF